MENWNHAKDIFYSALNKPPDEREIFLAEVCKDDSQLLSDVKILLNSYKSEFLEQPIIDFHNNTLTEIPTDSKFKTGDQINHYIILRILGRGGMGEVYLAKDKKLDRMVAIKILHQGAGEKAEKRLLREARSVAKLNHSNICSIYEVGKINGSSFIVMEFVEGKTLDELIKTSSITIANSIEIICQIGSALEEAHSQNIIHRDIKPSNIIVDFKNQVKVLDFGLAKEILLETERKNDSFLSEVGVIAGTVAYMSPEQARGQTVDARSDIWSLAVVFYETLSGKLPFSGESKSDLIVSILTKNPPKLSELYIDFSPDFDEIICKALQKNREQRYSSVKDFCDNLEMLFNANSTFTKLPLTKTNRNQFAQTVPGNQLSNDSLNHSTFSELGKITVQSKSNLGKNLLPTMFGWKWLVPAFLTVSLLFGGVYWKFFNNAPKFESFSADSRGRLQISTLFGVRRKLQGSIPFASFSPDGKSITFVTIAEGATDIYVKLLNQSEPTKLTDGKWVYQTPVWSPDGQQIAFVSNRDNKNAIWTISPNGGTPNVKTNLDIDIVSCQLLKWSNDGKRLFFQTGRGLKTIELDSGEINEIKFPLENLTSNFSISSDESLVAFVTMDGENAQLWTFNFKTNELNKITNGTDRPLSPALLPDSKRLLFISIQNGNAQLYVTDFVSKKPTQITLGDSNASYPIVSPDGNRIVYISETNIANIFSLDVNSKKEERLTEETKMQLFPDLSKDQSKLIFQVTDEFANFTISPLKFKNLQTNSESVLENQKGSWAKWSPTFDEIAYLRQEGREINIWKTDLKGQTKKMTEGGVSVDGFKTAPFNMVAFPFAWSPDGRKLVFTSDQSKINNIRTIDSDGTNIQMLTNNDNSKIEYSSPTWSPDGNKIAVIKRLKIAPDKFQYGVSLISNNQQKDILLNELKSRLLGWESNGTNLLVSVNNPDEVQIYELSETVAPKLLTKLVKADFHSLTLSSDGKTIAYSARRDKIDNIFSYSINGKEKQLTDNKEDTILFSGIAWSPAGDRIFYSKQSGSIQISMISDNPESAE